MACIGDWHLQRVGCRETIYHLPQEGQVLIKRYQPNKKNKNSSEVTFFLNSSRVSRHHAKLIFQNNIWHVVDCESMNGVYINNIKIPKNELNPLGEGDIIGFGGSDANERNYYIFKVGRKASLQTAVMDTNQLIIKEDHQDDSVCPSQSEPSKSRTESGIDMLDETQPNLSIVGQSDTGKPDMDETMPLLVDQTDYDNDVMILEMDEIPCSSTLQANGGISRTQSFDSPTKAPNRDLPTEEDDSTYNDPPSLEVYGPTNPFNVAKNRKPEASNFNTGVFTAEIRRRGGGRTRRSRGRRGASASRWSPINITSTNRGKRNSSRVPSETAPSIWNIGTRVTRNIAAKLMSQPLTSTPTQSKHLSTCDGDSNSRANVSVSSLTDIEPSVINYTQAHSPVICYLNNSNPSAIDTDTLPLEDFDPQVFSPEPLTNCFATESELNSDSSHGLLKEICATFQDLLYARPSNFNQSLRRLDALKMSLSKLTCSSNFKLSEQIQVTLSSNEVPSSPDSSHCYQIVLPIRPNPCPVDLINSMKQIGPIHLGPGAWRDGCGLPITLEQMARIQKAQSYALTTSVDLNILKGLSERYAF